MTPIPNTTLQRVLEHMGACYRHRERVGDKNVFEMLKKLRATDGKPGPGRDDLIWLWSRLKYAYGYFDNLGFHRVSDADYHRALWRYAREHGIVKQRKAPRSQQDRVIAAIDRYLDSADCEPARREHVYFELMQLARMDDCNCPSVFNMCWECRKCLRTRLREPRYRKVNYRDVVGMGCV